MVYTVYTNIPNKENKNSKQNELFFFRNDTFRNFFFRNGGKNTSETRKQTASTLKQHVLLNIFIEKVVPAAPENTS